MDFFKSSQTPKYDFLKLRSNLRMSVTRLQSHQNKRVNNVRAQRRELATLLTQSKTEAARVKVEPLLRESKMIKGLDDLAIFLELISSRVHVINDSRSCPPELKEAITSVLWAIPRLDNIPEFNTIRLQFALKYSKAFCEMAAANEEFSVNERLLDLMSLCVPSATDCVAYMQGIADEFGVAFDADALLPAATDSHVEIAPPVAGGSRFFIPPITVPRDDLEARLLVLQRS